MPRLRASLTPLIVPLLLVLAWGTWAGDGHSPFFPALQSIWRRFFELWVFAEFPHQVLPSLQRFAAGLMLGVVAGTALGLALGLSRRVERDLRPTTEFLRAMPVATLVPAALVFFGRGWLMEVALITYVVIWPISINAMDAARRIDPVMVDVARIFGFSKTRTLASIVLPAALPQFFVGIRIAVPVALGTTILANMIGSSSGLGYFVMYAQSTFRITDMWTGIVLLAIVGFAVNATIVGLERSLLSWHRGWRAAVGSSG